MNIETTAVFASPFEGSITYTPEQAIESLQLAYSEMEESLEAITENFLG